MRYLHRTITAIAVLATIGVAAPAAAAEGDVYCVARADGGDSQAMCFDTFDKALQFASGGVLIDLPKGSSTDAKVKALNAGFGIAGFGIAGFGIAGFGIAGFGIAAVNTVISIDYESSNFGGSALIWVGSSGNCSTSTGNIDYQISSMPAGWHNRVSSYRTYANCWAKHYENSNYGGASIGYRGTDSYIGAALDNRTSSQRWS